MRLTRACDPDTIPPMDSKTRLNLVVSAALYGDLQKIARESGSSMSEIFRIAFGLYKVCHEAKKTGRHIGIVNDREKLDTELVGLI
jgi:hypothetical protein